MDAGDLSLSMDALIGLGLSFVAALAAITAAAVASGCATPGHAPDPVHMTAAEAAQAVADQLIAAGVPGILNFAPKRLDVKNAVSVVSVDFSVALEQLAFQVSLGFTGSLDEE